MTRVITPFPYLIVSSDTVNVSPVTPIFDQPSPIDIVKVQQWSPIIQTKRDDDLDQSPHLEEDSPKQAWFSGAGALWLTVSLLKQPIILLIWIHGTSQKDVDVMSEYDKIYPYNLPKVEKRNLFPRIPSKPNRRLVYYPLLLVGGVMS